MIQKVSAARRHARRGEVGKGGREYYALPDRVIMSVPWDDVGSSPISSGQRFRGIEKLLSIKGPTFNEIPQTLANLGISPHPLFERV